MAGRASQSTLAFPHGPGLATLPPLSLYVHIPWCVRKCPYCDFNSHEIRSEPRAADTVLEQSAPKLLPIRNSPEMRGDIPEDAYVAALSRDLEQALPLIWGRRIYTIFFGGGTPSLLSDAAVDRLLANFRALLPLEYCSEITLEANPGTFEAAKFRGFRAAGVNRLSIGIQSFNDRHLRALGRIHDAHQARRAIEIAHQHFDNFNLDLMYALPEQTLAEARRDIEAAIAAAPTHISAYQLTLEPNTLFHRYPPALPDGDLAADMQAMIEATLSQAGYRHYETSAFAKPGREARHNMNYWQFGDYLGIGAGAHSKISSPQRILRQIRHKQPQAYMNATASSAAVQEEREVSSDDLPFEFMMNGLRLTEGIPAAFYGERTGLPLNGIEKVLNAAERRGLIERDHLTIRPTQQGQRFLNDLLQMFL
jgi:putative oxygen-independent coproporphyrinogen III oxidase